MIIKRARGHRLYSVNGEKILDLSMDYSRAVIGHRPNGLSLTIKNIVDKGIYSRYSNIYEQRLVKYLNIRFPDYKYVTFLDHELKLKAVINSKIEDPLYNSSKVKVSYWRPFLPDPKCDIMVVLYPLPGLNTTAVCISKNRLDIESDSISPILAGGILRSLNDYDKEYKSFNPENYNSFKEIKNSTLKVPYLLFDYKDDDYKLLYEESLKDNILLNNREQIAILPSDYSEGEVKKVIKVLNRR